MIYHIHATLLDIKGMIAFSFSSILIIGNVLKI